jgi:hypothetical protein
MQARTCVGDTRRKFLLQFFFLLCWMLSDGLQTMTPGGKQVPIDARRRLVMHGRKALSFCIAYKLWLSHGRRSGLSNAALSW